MLDKALERLPEHHQLLMYTDQGWHYQMNKYRRALESRGGAQSMSRKGNCYEQLCHGEFLWKSEFLYMRELESIDH